MSDNIKAKFGLQRKRSYLDRDFTDFRGELLRYANTYFKDKIQDFSEASMGGLFLDMAAYIGDNMSFYLDHQFNELNPTTAVESKNIEAMVRNAGIKILGDSPSSVMVDFYIEILPYGHPSPQVNSAGERYPDPDYLPIIKSNAKLRSNNGVIFNLTEDIDFSEKNLAGEYTAEVIKLTDSSGNISSFVFKKAGLCVSGEITEETVVIPNNFVQFRTISLNNPNVTSIMRVYDSDGNDYFEVESLSQDTVFKKNKLTSGDTSIEVVTAPYRYIAEVDINSRTTKLRFGAGNSSAIRESAVPDAADLALPLYGKKTFSSFSLDPNKLLQSPSLGVSPVDTTMKILYRYGGGANHNVGVDTIKEINEVVFKFPGSAIQYDKTSYIRNSLGISNPTEATGGALAPSLLELKNHVQAARTMQNRVVTMQDLMARIYTLPTEFGIVYRANVTPNPENALSSLLYVVSRDSAGQMVPCSDALKRNLSIYLNEFRLIGDAMDILDANVINFKIHITCRVSHNTNKYDAISKIVREVRSLYTQQKMALGKPLILSDISNAVYQVPGIVSCSNVEITNLYGAIQEREYSMDSKNIEVKDDICHCEPYEIFELRFPNNDIEVTVL